MSDKLREALEAARELASGWQYAGKQWDEAQEVARLVDEALADDDAARGTMPAAYETVESSIVGRYKVVKRNGGGFWPYCVQAGDGTMELFIGHKTQCERVAAALQAACLDGAFMASRAADDIGRGAMREEFEAWAEREGLTLTTEIDVAQICGQTLPAKNAYVDRATNAAWISWQASRAATPQSVERVCRDDGRCQYAIDHGAEGLGHCPKGKCAMPSAPTDAEWLEEAMRRYHDMDERGLRAHLSTRPRQAPTEADRLDAQRYRWLAETLWTCELNQYSGPHNRQYLWSTRFSSPLHNENASLGGAIDAAMSAQAGGKEQGS